MSPPLFRAGQRSNGLTATSGVARVSRPCPYGAFVRVALAKGAAPAFASSARNLGLAHFEFAILERGIFAAGSALVADLLQTFGLDRESAQPAAQRSQFACSTWPRRQTHQRGYSSPRHPWLRRSKLHSSPAF